MKQQRRTSVPWVFHVVLAALFVVWILSAPQDTTWSAGWWWPWRDVDGFVIAVVAFVCVAVAPVAALLEVSAVAYGLRWLARGIALLYLLPAGFVASFPVTFRLAPGPFTAEGWQVSMFMQAYALFVVVQLATVLLVLPHARRVVLGPATRLGGATGRLNRVLYRPSQQ